jgi:signal transduction histidine kinase
MLREQGLSPEILIVIITLCLAVLLFIVLAAYRRRRAMLAQFHVQEKQLRQLHRRLEQLEESSSHEVLLFSEITSILGNIQDPEESLKAAFGRMIEILSVDFGFLELAQRRAMAVKVFVGCEENLVETLTEIGSRGWVLEDKPSPLNALSFEEYQKSKHFRAMEDVHSLLSMPCRVKTVLVGHFTVGFRRLHHYTAPELDTMHFCADQFAVTYQMWAQLLDTQELSQLRHDYIANVSHELRTPLTTIYGYLNILKTYPAHLFQEQEMQDMFGTMTDECQRLIRLINNLLLSVKVEQEGFSGTMNPIAVSLAKVVAQTCRFMDGEIKAKNVELIIDMPEDLAPIEGNLDLLYQVFQNLIANSIKFSGKSPRIEISAHEADAEHVVVHVADNGVGIEKEAIPKIFQKFYRAESQATRRPGLGIGLFLVQKLVQLHHGEISVTSELNRGTRFILKFPKLTSAESQSQRAAG